MVLMLVHADDIYCYSKRKRNRDDGSLTGFPLQPVLVILAKSTPYLLLSAINIASILLLSVFILGLPIAGSIVLLVLLSLLFTVTSLSLGMLISSITASQQTAMLISLMGLFSLHSC